MLVFPDPDSAILDPVLEVPTLSLTCFIRDPRTLEPFSRDPRYIAYKAEKYLKSTGIGDVSFWGPEAEFYIFSDIRFDQGPNFGYYFIDSREGIWNSGKDEKPNRGYRPRHKKGYFPVPPMDTFQDLRSTIMLTMEMVGIESEGHHHEVATAGQAEIDMKYDSLVRMADKVMLFKYIVKNVCRRAGFSASFMPKPLFQDTDCGMHVHRSIWKSEKNLFYDERGHAGLSQTARYYVGGLLKHAPALLAFAAPSTNSYRRLVPGFEAPVNLVYSQRNRSAAVRSGEHSESAMAPTSAAAERLNLSTEKRQILETLVRQHLLLVRTARLQDLKLPSVILAVADKCSSVEILRHLYVFTYADTRAVAEKSWTSLDYRDLAGLAESLEISGELADLAEACLRATVHWTRLPAERIPDDYQERLHTIALGKLGSCQMHYSSDLDLVFLYDAPVDRGEEARRDVGSTLERMGFQVEAAHHELAPGQNEIDFKLVDAMEAADNMSTCRFVVRKIALDHGLHATFMPKPLFGRNGSGLHLYQELQKNLQNAFFDPERKYRLSSVALHYIGGLIEHTRGMAVITNPLVNSYKRLVPNYEAPTHVAWSETNRSPLIRISPWRREGTLCEFRLPDPSCNPYLCLAAILSSGMEGIRHRLDPGQPVNKDILTMSQRERTRLRIQNLPGDLSEAIRAFEKDKFLQIALGSHISNHMIQAKRKEWQEYIGQVHPWESDRYLAYY